MGDFAGNGRLDLAVVNEQANTVSVLLGNGEGTFQPAKSQTVGYGPMSLVTADINGDGHPDLIVGNGDSETAGVLLGQGDGTLRTSATYFVGTTAATGLGFVATGDFNGDGAPDMAGADLGPAFESNGVVSIVLNRGDGTFPAPLRTALPAGASLFQQASADFNGDGIPDLAVLAAAGRVNVELGFGDGSFGSVTALAAGPRAAALAAGDFNGDGTADIAVTSSSIDPGLATLLLNSPGWDYSPYAGAVGFRVSAPATTTAGSAVAVMVTAVDAAGNPVPGFRGEVHLDSAGPGAALPGSLAATHTFTAADGGTFTFTTTLKTAGSQSLTVQDAANAAVLGSQTGIAVTAGAAVRFVLSTVTSATQGVGFTITVTVLDAYGNIATGYRGKVHFSTTAANAGLPSDYTFSSSDNGVHVFSVTVNTLGLQTIQVTDAANSSILGSALVNVVAKTSGGGGGGSGGGGTGGGGGSGGSGGSGSGGGSTA